jgi:hypothetical protein
MPTKREREYYSAGFQDGVRMAQSERARLVNPEGISPFMARELSVEMAKDTLGVTPSRIERGFQEGGYAKRKRKLSAWQKYIKNKRNHIKYRDGKLNLKKMGVEFRRKKRR